MTVVAGFRAFSFVVVSGAVGAPFAACSSFETSPGTSEPPGLEGGADAPPVVPGQDGGRDPADPADASALPGEVAIDAPGASEISVVGTQLFISTGGGRLFRWNPSMGRVPSPVTPDADEATKVFARGTDHYWLDRVGRVVKASASDGGAPGVPMPCHAGPAILSFALAGDANNVLVHGTSTVVNRGPSGSCATPMPLRDSVNATLMTFVPAVNTEVAFYDANGRTIVRCPQSTACADADAGQFGLPAGERATAITADTLGVYWSTSAGIYAWPDSAPAATKIADSASANSLVAHEGDLYWTVPSTGTVMAVGTSGGTPRVVASGLRRPWGLAWFFGNLYVADRTGDVVYRLPSDSDK